jgi:hypothetical protein
MAEHVRVREITNDEGNRLLRTVRRSAGSVVTWRRGDLAVVICMDEFGPLNLQPHPGRQWAPVAVGAGSTSRQRRRRRRATYTRPHGVRHLLAGYDLSTKTDSRVGD